MVVTYRNRMADGQRWEVTMTIDDSHFETLFDRCNALFCGHLPALPEPISAPISGAISAAKMGKRKNGKT